MNQVCNAIKANGDVCDKNVREQGKCGCHYNAIINFGPNTVARRELKYTQKKELRVLEDLVQRELSFPVDDGTRARLALLVERRDVMTARHRREATILHDEQQRLVRETGVNPDAAAEARQRFAAEQRRRNQLREAVWINQAANNWINQAGRLGAAVRIQPVQGELARFVGDAQNVHTTVAVNQTKEIVSRIRQVPVPTEYRWDPVNSSKTPFEIGLECKLSQRASWQMISQYAQDTSIYDIEEGIYGKVLDSVWQFVKNSPEKEDLCKIIKSEMEDNVGMCAQGNLSRICNILAGYMDGVGSQESLSERLGNIFSRLSEIENPHERFGLAYDELKKNNVPENRWSIWTSALVADEGDEEIMVNVRALVV